jgi:hypothetical protein
MRNWLAVRGDTPACELFVNARGLPMTRSGFEYILHKHVKTAAQACASLQKKHISPHVLRHTSAMLVLEISGRLRYGWVMMIFKPPKSIYGLIQLRSLKPLTRKPRHDIRYVSAKLS